MLYISGYRSKPEPESCVEDLNSFISVNCCGYEKYITRNISTLRKNGRPDFQLIYIFNGYGYFLADGSMQEVHKGSIIIYHPGEPQEYNYSHHNSAEVYWVHFTGHGANDIIKDMGLINNHIFSVGDCPVYAEYFTQIIHELQLKPFMFGYAVDAALLALLTCMGRYVSGKKNNNKPAMDDDIKRAVEQMHERYAYNWNVASLADLCNLSPDWFMHKFRNQAGIPPMEYLAGIRLDKAKWLIRNSSLSIKEISYLTGYENPLYFSRIFKKAEGISPVTYRNNNN